MQKIRNFSRRLKLAIKALGPKEGANFIFSEMWRKDGEYPAKIFEDGNSRTAWVRYHTTDLNIFEQIFVKREYDFKEWNPYHEYIYKIYDSINSKKRTPIIIDGGANAGYSAIWFAIKYPKARILAVEPDPENFKILKKNVEDFPNVTPIHAALWSEKTNVSIVNPKSGAWGRRVGETNEESDILGVTVVDLLNREDDYVPLIAKIDIEGAETKLFRGCTKWADKFPLFVFETHDEFFHWLGPWQGSAHAFFSTLTRQKREYLRRGENIFAFLHSQDELPV